MGGYVLDRSGAGHVIKNDNRLLLPRASSSRVGPWRGCSIFCRICCGGSPVLQSRGGLDSERPTVGKSQVPLFVLVPEAEGMETFCMEGTSKDSSEFGEI